MLRIRFPFPREQDTGSQKQSVHRTQAIPHNSRLIAAPDRRCLPYEISFTLYVHSGLIFVCRSGVSLTVTLSYHNEKEKTRSRHVPEYIALSIRWFQPLS